MSLLIKNWSEADWKELLKWAKIGLNNAMIGEFAEVEELPPHGRLIDADAFESIKYELPDGQKAFNRGFHNGVQYVQRLIMDAPTIIPAEEGE